VDFLKDKFRAERERNKAKYGVHSSDEEEEEESIEEVDSFDDENKEFVERIPWEKDYAAHVVVDENKESSSEPDDDEDEVRTAKMSMVN